MEISVRRVAGWALAASLLALLPSVLLVLMLQKFVVQGLSVGAVKG